MLYVVLLLVAASLVLIDESNNFNKKRHLRFKPRQYKTGKNFFVKQVSQFVNKYHLLKSTKHKYANKLCLINKLSKKQNEVKIDEFILISILGSLMVGAIVMMFFTMWYIFVFAFLLSIFSIIYIGVMYISVKLFKIYALFPSALQLYTDEYVTYKNIKLALDSSYGKMPSQISRVFENLARKFASENDYEKIINDFAEGLDFTWGYAFSEILLLSYEGAGEISEDLIYLSELSSEQIRSNLETDTALSGTKMIFLILNAVTLVGFILNLVFMPLSKELYFYTQTGNTAMMFWGLSFASGLLTLAIMKHI